VTQYFCCDARRREAVRRSANLNGIDFLEVVDNDATTPADRQRILRVHFLKTPAPRNIVPANVVIDGGERIRDLRADRVSYEGEVLVVHLTAYGDFSTYRLRLVEGDGSGKPLAGLDPLLGSVDFSFKVECPSEFDCKTEHVCAPEPQASPDINYLAKDYATFRQLMLDRLAVLAPDWRERNAADLGVVLVELLASVADYLSYQQDAVATEAYIGTARRRVSIKRHARLVDYPMHDGVNARMFVHVDVAADITLPKRTQLLSFVKGQPPRLARNSAALAQALSLGPEIFETMHDIRLLATHNRFSFYTWGDGRCCLPKAATRATLKGRHPNLAAGAVLIFEEVIGPETGKPEDADRTRRHAVRLTKAAPAADPLGGQFEVPPSANAVDVTEIEWSLDDALPFPICVSCRIASDGGEREFSDVSVARGNIVLADHGLTVVDEPLGRVPDPVLFRSTPMTGDPCAAREPKPVPPRFRPSLGRKPLTHALAYDEAHPPASASATLRPAIAEALPVIGLTGTLRDRPPVSWTATRDLLDEEPSGPDATNFVVETESDGTAYLRFGDNQHGQRPASGMTFSATYRIGNGAQGNVGADAIGHIVSSDPAIRLVRNPLPAQGGINPESIEEVRQNAPIQFRAQERAVTPDDYASIAQNYRPARRPEVQRAAATFRWTGSWRTVFLTVDRFGGEPVDAAFETGMRGFMEPFRVSGHDLEVDAPRYAPLEIEMRVCVEPDYFRSDVKAALLQTFSSRRLPDGRRGVFHPDNFTFGQAVYLSPLYAAAEAIDGIASAQITTFQRQGQASREALDRGKLELGRLEIARLENNPDFPERGVFRVSLEGGK
jgi:hypothetical protein